LQAVGRQPQRAPDGAPVHYERHRPEQTTLYRLVQQHAASFIAHTEASPGAELPRFIKDEFDAFLESGILAHGLGREWVYANSIQFGCRAGRTGVPYSGRLGPPRPVPEDGAPDRPVSRRICSSPSLRGTRDF